MRLPVVDAFANAQNFAQHLKLLEMIVKQTKRQLDVQAVNVDAILSKSSILKSVDKLILGRVCCSMFTIRECRCSEALTWRCTAAKTRDLIMRLERLEDLPQERSAWHYARLRRETRKVQRIRVLHDAPAVVEAGADAVTSTRTTRHPQVHLQTHATNLRSDSADAGYYA